MQSCLDYYAEAESGQLADIKLGSMGGLSQDRPEDSVIQGGKERVLSVTTTWDETGEEDYSVSLSSYRPQLSNSDRDRTTGSSVEAQSTGLLRNTERQDYHAQLQATLKTYQKALAVAQAKNNRPNQVNILKRIGIIHCKLGEDAWGIKCLRQALQLAQSLGNQISVGIILNYLGAAYRQTGQDYKALRVYLRALDLFKGIGNEAGIALLLNHLGEVYNSLGQLDQGLLCSRQALEKLQALGNSPDGEGAALYNIGEIYLQLKRYRQALALFEQALAIYRKVRNRKGEVKVLEGIATAYVKLDQNRRALDVFSQALDVNRKAGNSPHAEARCFDYIGAVYCKMGNPARAMWYHLQALGMLQAYSYTAGIERFDDETALVARLLRNLVVVYDRLGLHEPGVKCYQKAIEIVKTFGENACEEAIQNYLKQEV